MDALVKFLEQLQNEYNIDDNKMNDLAKVIGNAIGELKGKELSELEEMGKNAQPKEEVEEEDGNEGIEEEDNEEEFNYEKC